MKTFIVSLILMAIIVAGSICYDIALEKMTQQAGLYAQKAGEALAAGDFAQAGAQTQEMKDYWEKRKKLLSLFVDHAYLDAVEISVEELEQNIIYANGANAAAACAKTQAQIEDIAQNERLELANLL